MILCCGEALVDMIPTPTRGGPGGFVPHSGGTDVLDDPFAVAPLGSGFLSRLHSLVVTMCQKPPLIKST